MLFPTHDSVEHLALMTKLIGQFPRWMITFSSKEFKSCFRPSKDNAKELQIDWPACAPEEVSLSTYNNMKPIEEEVLEEDREFSSLLRFLLKADPKERPSAAQALEHEFFRRFNIVVKGVSTSQSSSGLLEGNK
eukprot:TRINITY_DN4691_c0_g1_i2.p2 TRINITY_DN4691_c0_g1~~TRINITY_DN4691_c0_g1_i2.p2  ORF type:complete len:134 (-),score=35.58 TRINITY_DN4691_c0_g1_i2:946-1347(-)